MNISQEHTRGKYATIIYYILLVFAAGAVPVSIICKFGLLQTSWAINVSFIGFISACLLAALNSSEKKSNSQYQSKANKKKK